MNVAIHFIKSTRHGKQRSKNKHQNSMDASCAPRWLLCACLPTCPSVRLSCLYYNTRQQKNDIVEAEHGLGNIRVTYGIAKQHTYMQNPGCFGDFAFFLCSACCFFLPSSIVIRRQVLGAPSCGHLVTIFAQHEKGLLDVDKPLVACINHIKLG